MKNLTIEPLKGYGNIKFGMSVEEIIEMFGEPSNHEELEPLMEENENYCILYDYDEEELSIYFEGITSLVVANISTKDDEATLFGERIYSMNRNQIVEMMKKNGYKIFEEEEQDGDTCIIYDELMLDFYFKDGELIDVLWGVLVDSQGNII